VYYVSFVCSYLMRCSLDFVWLGAPANLQFTTSFYAKGDPTVDAAAEAARKVVIASSTFIFAPYADTLSFTLTHSQSRRYLSM
jgi:hypothetical protein